ncbi:MAG: cyclic nucleotide-binding domain-containing protein [Gaiellaceae bacterium]
MSSSRVDLLQRVPLFADLQGRDLESIASGLKEVTFKEGQEVTTEGGGGVGFFVIQDGEASVSVGGQERGKLHAGDYFGEIALIAKSDRTATITADSELRCLGMTSWDFRPLVENNGAIAWKLMQAIAKKLHAVEQRAGEN